MTATQATPSPARRRHRPILVGLLGWVIMLLVVLALAAVVAVGANRPADPRLASPDGFGEIAFHVGPAAGSGLPASAQRCALLAETEAQHRRGLMGRRDLGGYDGMIFRFAADTAASFYMRNTPLPLSIAWFDAEGRFVSSADMVPCPDRDGCPQYAPGRAYRFALEVPRGGLAALGVDADSVLTLDGDCSA